MKFLRIFNDLMKVGLANYSARAIGAFIIFILARWLGQIDFGIYSIGFHILTILGTSFIGFDQCYVHFAVKDLRNKERIFSTYTIIKLGIPLFILLIFSC
jgi:O-antigen/teichoic acid export membrane protein